jgi:hypothetical protein
MSVASRKQNRIGISSKADVGKALVSLRPNKPQASFVIILGNRGWRLRGDGVLVHIAFDAVNECGLALNKIPPVHKVTPAFAISGSDGRSVALNPAYARIKPENSIAADAGTVA